jgi:hypothetical protein
MMEREVAVCIYFFFLNMCFSLNFIFFDYVCAFFFFFFIVHVFIPLFFNLGIYVLFLKKNKMKNEFKTFCKAAN